MACMAQRGLLTLRNCDNPEARNCAKCGRPMCSEHLSARSGHTMCLECAAADPDKDHQYDAEWASGYRRECVGLRVPKGIYLHVSGIDLIRDENGNYLVLEDNCRTPSGVSYAPSP